MIYESVSPDAPLRQGDIFVGLPRVEVALSGIVVLDENGETSVCTWRDIVQNNNEITAVLPVRPVIAIVANQDCDASRSHDITLCEIRGFRQVEKKSAQTTSPKSMMNIVTQQARIN